MLQLTETHLHYLLAIYELGQLKPVVRAAEIANRLKISKPSVTRMLGVLAEKELLTREPYGKVDLTETGRSAVEEYRTVSEQLVCLIPKMGLDLTEDELKETAYLLAANLPERVLKNRQPV